MTQTVLLGDVAEKIAMGPFGSNIKVSTFVESGVPVVSGQHLKGITVDDNEGYSFISTEHADRLKNSNVFRGDVVFTHTLYKDKEGKTIMEIEEQRKRWAEYSEELLNRSAPLNPPNI